MDEHSYTVAVYEDGPTPTREFSGIRANTGDGAIDRVADMFKINPSACRWRKEA